MKQSITKFAEAGIQGLEFVAGGRGCAPPPCRGKSGKSKKTKSHKSKSHKSHKSGKSGGGRCY